MALLSIVPQFLYPHSRQFPFDEIAENIVAELSKRNFDIPGIKVEFDIYGSGEAKYRLVRRIIGKDFLMYFCRVQGNLAGSWNDTAALRNVFIPMQEITVYEDESGPTYTRYAGDDWEKDKEWFMTSIKVNSKLRGEPKRYIKYKGTTYKERTTLLVADDDLGREYAPEGYEPNSFKLVDVFREFTTWLKENVLAYILSFPETECTKVGQPVEQELIPYKGMWQVVYSLCNEREGYRIMKGMHDASMLEPQDRHASFGIGPRLVSLDVKSNGKVPKIAYDGFIWCDVNQELNQSSTAKDLIYNVRSAHCLFDACNVVAISPNYANGIYVADNAKYVKKRQQLFEEVAPRTRLTDEEIGLAYAMRGATIVPINEYDGSYEEPIVLINRELDFDEIKWLSYHHS